MKRRFIQDQQCGFISKALLILLRRHRAMMLVLERGSRTKRLLYIKEEIFLDIRKDVSS